MLDARDRLIHATFTTINLKHMQLTRPFVAAKMIAMTMSLYFAWKMLICMPFYIFLVAFIFLIAAFVPYLQSVVSEGKSHALDVSFVRAPIGMDLDWQLIAKISPCHVTVLI